MALTWPTNCLLRGMGWFLQIYILSSESFTEIQILQKVVTTVTLCTNLYQSEKLAAQNGGGKLKEVQVIESLESIHIPSFQPLCSGSQQCACQKVWSIRRKVDFCTQLIHSDCRVWKLKVKSFTWDVVQFCLSPPIYIFLQGPTLQQLHHSYPMHRSGSM